MLSTEHLSAVKEFLSTSSEWIFNDCKQRQFKKFKTLIDNKHSKNSTNKVDEFKSKWVINLSQKKLSSAQTSLLSKGLNFALTLGALGMLYTYKP